VEVLGLEHVDLTVNDIARSTAFYSYVLEALGFKRFAHPAEHVSWSNGKLSITIRPAAADVTRAQFNRYRVGLHHLAFKLKARGDVDGLHRLLLDRSLTVLDPPAEYPEYGADYYALFFADPDGLKLEAVHFPWGYWKRVQTEGRDSRPRWDPAA
jgi:glyoxylase I family protein